MKNFSFTTATGVLLANTRSMLLVERMLWMRMGKSWKETELRGSVNIVTQVNFFFYCFNLLESYNPDVFDAGQLPALFEGVENTAEVYKLTKSILTF